MIHHITDENEKHESIYNRKVYKQNVDQSLFTINSMTKVCNICLYFVTFTKYRSLFIQEMNLSQSSSTTKKGLLIEEISSTPLIQEVNQRAIIEIAADVKVPYKDVSDDFYCVCDVTSNCNHSRRRLEKLREV